jgi:glycosyltransferase involved in cell wall biosynthesis
MPQIAVVAHKYLPQPDDDLVAYLNAQATHRVLHIYHSFPDAQDRRSFFRLYEQGRLVSQAQTRDYRSWPEPLIYLKELFFTLKWALQLGGKWDRYIGMDGLCVLFGNMLRAAGRAHRTTFWAIDFVPNDRFSSRAKNAIYRMVNHQACTRADEVWDLGPRMADARAKFAGIGRDSYRSHKVVPYGLWLDRMHPRSFAECEQRTVVFMGHLLEKQGAQLVIRAMPRLLEKIPGLTFKIIGDGSYRPTLEHLASAEGVSRQCVFMGKIPTPEELEDEVAKAAVAIAPYVRELDKWTAYADPGKVKTYLACGVPVLLTDVPWNAREIEARGCGKLISEDVDDIVASIVSTLEPATNSRMRDNARQYAREFGWQRIFSAALPDATPPG